MTMINAVVQRKTGYLFADTAMLDSATGNAIAFGTKIFSGTLFPWAVGVTFTGNPGAWTPSVEMLKGARNVAALRTALTAGVAQFRERSEAADTLRLTAVAWDARQKTPRIFAIGDMAEDAGVPCDAVEEFEWLFGSPLDHRHLWSRGTPSNPKAFDPETTGVAVMQERRASPDAITPGGAAHCIVGGEVEMAEITRDGVTLYGIHTWPDRVGAPLGLAA